MREALLFVHPTFGIIGVLGALWVFVEAFKADEERLRRMKIVSLIVAAVMILTWFSGGIWDSIYYDEDREVMAKGSWAVVGDTMMEMKEHLFVIVLLLALYLPIVVYATDPRKPEASRIPTMTVAGLLVLFGIAMEGAGAIIAGSVHVGVSTLLAS